jgi:integrase
MAIRKRKDREGYWVDWYDENGRRHLKRFTRKDDAEKAERATLIARDRGEAPIFADGKVTVREAAKKYLQVGKWVPKERGRVEQIFRIHLLPVFGEKLLSRVKRLDVEEYVAHRLGEQAALKQKQEKPREKTAERRRRQGASTTTINKEVMRLRHLFNEAKAWGWIYRNPCDGVKGLPEPPPIPKYLNEDEQARLFRAADTYKPAGAKKNDPPDATLGDIVRTAFMTGGRLSEILGLRVCDVDLSQGFILFTQKTKTRKVRRVEIFPELLPVLIRRIERSASSTETLFPSEWTQERVTMAFRRAAKRAKLSGFRFHDLRHAFASRLTMNGAPLQAVQAYLGHTTLRMTERYSHLSPSVHASTIMLLAGPRQSGRRDVRAIQPASAEALSPAA